MISRVLPMVRKTAKCLTGAGVAVCAAMLAAPLAQAVHPAHWSYHTEAQYATGTFDGTVVNNYGQLMLGHPVNSLLPDGKFTFVNALVHGLHGSIYFGTSPDGKVYRLAGGKVTAIYSPKGAAVQVLALAISKQGQILAGINADGKGELVKLVPQAGGGFARKIIFSNSAVRYIWCILPMADGSIYLGTGPDGIVWRCGSKGAAKAVLHTDEHNVMALLNAGGGHIIAATDGAGLVMRYSEKTKNARVLLAADNAEVDALAMDRQGDIFAATASPVLAQSGGGAFVPQGTSNGRPVAVSDDAGMAGAKGQAGKPAPGKPVAKQHVAKMLLAGPRPLPFPHTGHVKSNAVYQIEPNGRTSVLLRVPDMVLSMLYSHHHLLLGLSGHGRVVSYDPITQSRTMVVFSHSCHDIMCSVMGRHGRVYFGTANGGQIFRMEPGFAPTGSYTSKVLDAALPAIWGAAHVNAEMPAGASVFIRTRSGNVKNVRQLGRFWSPWSAPMPANSYRTISSPSGRYLQFRIMLMAGKAKASPVVESARVNYQQLNVPPVIDSITAVKMEGKPVYTIKWSASDPNGDKLTYRLEYKQQGIPVWIRIHALPDNSPYLWNISGLPEGRYRIKLIADDAADNTPQTALRVARETRYILVDTQSPKITQLKTTVKADGRVQVVGVASDSGSAIVAMAIQVDSQKHWQPAQASDKMFDSPLEGFKALTARLKPGPHRIVVRATDSQGNSGYASVLATVR
ncbi:MAG: hypothetical protein ACP5O7_04220 [Phycisphaerae bacterium]